MPEYRPEYQYDSTFPQEEPEQKPKNRIRFYLAAIRWLWRHRQEPNNRHKWRRMMKEVQE